MIMLQHHVQLSSKKKRKRKKKLYFIFVCAKWCCSCSICPWFTPHPSRNGHLHVALISLSYSSLACLFSSQQPPPFHAKLPYKSHLVFLESGQLFADQLVVLRLTSQKHVSGIDTDHGKKLSFLGLFEQLRTSTFILSFYYPRKSD